MNSRFRPGDLFAKDYDRRLRGIDVHETRTRAMAHYVTTIRTKMTPDDAFAYMADLENFAEWDPGVSLAEQVAGDGPGLGAAYRVKASGAELVYKVIEFDSPRRLVAEAKTTFFRSYDIIDVEAREDGCDVTYDATLELNGILGLADLGLRLFFDKIGDKAAAGMVEALDGSKIR